MWLSDSETSCCFFCFLLHNLQSIGSSPSRAHAHAHMYRSELDGPDRRLWAITFVVVHRFQKTRRFSSSLGVPHLRSRAAYTACCIFWGRLRAPAPPGPSDRGAAAWGIPISQRPRGGVARAFRSSFDPSEALRACSCHRSSLSHYQGQASQAATARHAIFRHSNRKVGQSHIPWRGAPPAEAHINRRSADPRPSTAAGPAQRAAVLFARVTSEPERYAK